jgi:transposase
VLVNEAYTTQTCPECGERHKPAGRVYSCLSCGFVGHRDVVGASNILARLERGEVGGMYPEKVSYRHAHNCRKNQKVSGVGASSGPCERVHVAWEQLSLL